MNDRIMIDSRVQHGKPVIRHTRVPVTRIVDGLAGGMTVAEVTQEYGVTDADVRAALSYAADLLDEDTVYAEPAAAHVIAWAALTHRPQSAPKRIRQVHQQPGRRIALAAGPARSNAGRIGDRRSRAREVAQVIVASYFHAGVGARARRSFEGESHGEQNP